MLSLVLMDVGRLKARTEHSLPILSAILLLVCTGVSSHRGANESVMPTMVLVGGALLSLAIFLLLREIGRGPRRVPSSTEILLRHDLRQPLTSALVWLELLAEKPGDLDYVRRATTELQRASRLVSQEAARRRRSSHEAG